MQTAMFFRQLKRCWNLEMWMWGANIYGCSAIKGQRLVADIMNSSFEADPLSPSLLRELVFALNRQLIDSIRYSLDSKLRLSLSLCCRLTLPLLDFYLR
ncbi:MAG: hypothetical protein ACKERG_00835 [Candidatus Hodgkinia cicadicola]